MTPPPEIVAEVDRLVAELDHYILVDPSEPTTSSFAVIAVAWGRFMRLVGLLDAAVASPFADSSAPALRRAGELVGGDAFRLSFWLVHIGEAIARRITSSSTRR
jgi:hypothetical protein